MVELIRIVGIRFKRAGKIYYFDPCDLSLRHGDQVLVNTAAGVEFGDVVVEPKSVPEDEVVQPLREVLRLVDGEDRQRLVANRRDEREASQIAAERIEAHNLPMRLVGAEYTFDRNRLTFFFTADNRVDFRALVHDLARQFGVRIELRQIGVRDEAKDVGGIGVCGRELCCTSWMGEFSPVSIRMAKQQELSLNPSKLTGQCGRLKCCLKFENDTYRAVRALLPAVKDRVAVVASAVNGAANGATPAAATVNGEPAEVFEGSVREVLVTRESVLLDIGEGTRINVSLKQIEAGEAFVLTGKLAPSEDEGPAVVIHKRTGHDGRQMALDTMRTARAEGAAGSEARHGTGEPGAAVAEQAVEAGRERQGRSPSQPVAGGGNEGGDRPGRRRRRRRSRRRSRRPRESGE